MRRSMATRVFASIVAAWFGFLTIQPLYATPCPHHQPELAELAQGLSIHADAGHSRASTGRDDSDMSHVSASGSHAMHDMPGHHVPGSHPCECLGAMCGTAPIAIAQAVARILPEIVTARIGMPTIASISPAPKVAPPYTLPFATAPPPALLA